MYRLDAQCKKTSISNRFPHESYSDLNEAAEPAKDTSGTPNDQAQKGQEEPMDVDPVPQPTVSNIVSQNSPSLALEKSLSLPTQPEFSHVSISDHLNTFYCKFSVPFHIVNHNRKKTRCGMLLLKK